VRHDRARPWLPCLVLVAVLGACETGSTEVTGGGTGPTEPTPTGPTETAPTGPTAATGPTAPTLEGTWSGTWQTDVAQVSGTFTWEIEATADGFTGTIDVEGTSCISSGSVDVTLDGDRITVGLVQAEEPVTFTGTISGDQMSGTYDAGTCPPPNSGSWEAVRS
jgi:hypothetical protein